MARKIISIIIILGIVFFGGYYTAKQLIPTDTEVDTGPIYATKPVIRGDISVGVNTSGQLNASDNGWLRPPESNEFYFTYKIEEFMALEGDLVKRGDKLIVLSSKDLDTEIDNLKETVKNKKNDLAQLIGISVDEIDSINPYDGIIITSPIKGRVSDLNASKGEKLEGLIAKVVDDSNFEVEFKLTETEYSKLYEGKKVFLKFTFFEGFYEGEIIELNPNSVPDNEGSGFGTTYVHWGRIKAANPGLIQPGMEVQVYDSIDGNRGDKLTFNAEVDKYEDEEEVYAGSISSSELVVTDILVNEKDYVEVGQPLVEIAGADVRELIQSKLDMIRSTERRLDKAIELSENLYVLAPMDGIVAKFEKQVGDTIEQWDWLGNIFNTNNMRIWTQVDDLDVVYIKQDSPVQVTINALPGETFEGKVTRVSQSGQDANGVIKYSVDIEVTGKGELRPGMQANCFIDAGKSEDTLLVPIEAVFEEDGIPKVEILKEDGTIDTIIITTGLMNDRYVEVLEGLEEGQEVVTGSSSDLLPSEHIKGSDTILPDTNNEE